MALKFMKDKISYYAIIVYIGVSTPLYENTI